MSGDYGSFETGWNEYMVPIEDLTRLTNKSGEAGVGCDMECVNYLRIFFHTLAGAEAEEITYAISTVYAINPEDLSSEGTSVPDLNPDSTEAATVLSEDAAGEAGQDVPSTGDSEAGMAGVAAICCVVALLLLIVPKNIKKRWLQ